MGGSTDAEQSRLAAERVEVTSNQTDHRPFIESYCGHSWRVMTETIEEAVSEEEHF